MYLTKYILYSWKPNESRLPYHVYTCTKAIMLFSEISFFEYVYLLVVLSLLVNPTLQLDLGCPVRQEQCFSLPGTSYSKIVIIYSWLLTVGPGTPLTPTSPVSP